MTGSRSSPTAFSRPLSISLTKLQRHRPGRHGRPDGGVEEVARNGYAQMQSRQIRGVSNIAFPVLGSAGHAEAALNIPYIERIDKKITPSITQVKEALPKARAAFRC